jgi:hypothetical protein
VRARPAVGGQYATAGGLGVGCCSTLTNHPHEYALPKASIESLKQILQSESPPSEIDAIRGFVVNFV